MIRGSQVKIFFLLLYFYQSCLNLPQTSIDARFVLLFEMKGTYWLVNKPKIKQQVAFQLPMIFKIQASLVACTRLQAILLVSWFIGWLVHWSETDCLKHATYGNRPCYIQHQKLYWLSGVIHIVIFKSIVQYKFETIKAINQLSIRKENLSCPTLFMYKRFSLYVFRLQGRISSFGLNPLEERETTFAGAENRHEKVSK